MAIKHVVTLGFGFADGVAFIPTIGFTPNTVTIPVRTLHLWPIDGLLTLFTQSATMTLFDHDGILTVDNDEQYP